MTKPSTDSHKSEKKQDYSYHTDDLSIMVALTSVQYEDSRRFIIEEFKEGLFKKYKAAVRKRFSKAETPIATDTPSANEDNDARHVFERYLYNCRAYYLFGRFDVALISLIDDFELANREFMPFNPINNFAVHSEGDAGRKEEGWEGKDYDYQIITGPSSFFTKGPAPGQMAYPKILEQSKKTFLKTKEESGHFPLLGICQLKMNNSLLIGTGGRLTRFVEQMIQEIVIEQKNELSDSGEIELDAILVESFGFHELTVLFFSNSLKAISKAILQIKESPFSRLNTMGVVDDEGFEALKKKTFCHEVFSQEKAKNEVKLKEQDDISDNHLFVGATTTFGYDFDHFWQGTNMPENFSPDKWLPFQKNERIWLNSKWLFKPGHTKKALKAIDGNENTTYRLTLDHSDMYFQQVNTKGENGDHDEGATKGSEATHPRDGFTLEDAIKNIKKNNDPKLQGHLRKMRSTPRIRFEGNDLSNLPDFNPSKHMKTEEILTKRLRISAKEIEQIHVQMRAIGVPKLVAHRIKWICSNFNSTIQDPMLYGFFVELRNFLKHKLIGSIDTFYKYRDQPGFSTYDAINNLRKLSDWYIEAHSNRFFNSHRFKELSDFKADWVGGIQQLTAAYDSTYKALMYPFGEKKLPLSFAYVSGKPGVESSEQCIRLNYFHLFQPATFLSIAGHEAANFFLSRLLVAHSNDLQQFPELPPYSHLGQDYGILDFEKLVKHLKAAGFSFLPAFKQISNAHTVNKITNPAYRRPQDKDDQWDSIMADFYKKHDHVFATCMRPETFCYFIIDLITLYFNYFNNPSLFAFWHWNQVLQDYRFFRKRGEPDLSSFIAMFLRIGVVTEWAKPGSLSMAFKPPSPILIEYWQHFYPAGVSFIREFLQLEPIQQWFKYFDQLAKQVVLVANDVPCTSLADQNRLFNDIIDEVKNQSVNLIKTKITSGDTETYFERKNTDPGVTKTIYITRLIYAYLHLIADWSQDSHVSTLPRDKKNGDTSPIISGTHSSLLFDPQGGLFTHDPQKRRDYFRVRSALMKALWDMGFVEKTSLVK